MASESDRTQGHQGRRTTALSFDFDERARAPRRAATERCFFVSVDALAGPARRPKRRPAGSRVETAGRSETVSDTIRAASVFRSRRGTGTSVRRDGRIGLATGPSLSSANVTALFPAVRVARRELAGLFFAL